MVVSNKNIDVDRENIQITANDIPFDYVNQIKYLGVWIDSKFRMYIHVQSVVSKISRQQCVLNRIKCNLSTTIKLKLFYIFASLFNKRLPKSFNLCMKRAEKSFVKIDTTIPYSTKNYKLLTYC